MPGSKFQYMFDPFWDLELGTWNLELGIWNLEFINEVVSKVRQLLLLMTLLQQTGQLLNRTK
jgi:hypothetical protein